MNLSIFKYSKYTFDDKKPYENVLLLLYRHWFIIFIKFLGLVLILFLPLILYLTLNSYFSYFADFGSIFWFLYMLYILIWWLAMFYSLTMYLLDIWLITDHRVIDSEQHGFFRRSISELNLSKIQDISVYVKGFIPTLLDFGNLEIQTAGSEIKFIFKQIPHPKEVKDLIMEAHNTYMNEHRGGVEVHEKTSGGV